MNEMIERVAKAIDKGMSENFIGIEDPSHWPEFIPGIARAAIKAMRDPTETMVKAGWEGVDLDNREIDPKTQWQAMIDAALENKK